MDSWFELTGKTCIENGRKLHQIRYTKYVYRDLKSDKLCVSDTEVNRKRVHVLFGTRGMLRGDDGGYVEQPDLLSISNPSIIDPTVKIIGDVDIAGCQLSDHTVIEGFNSRIVDTDISSSKITGKFSIENSSLFEIMVHGITTMLNTTIALTDISGEVHIENSIMGKDVFTYTATDRITIKSPHCSNPNNTKKSISVTNSRIAIGTTVMANIDGSIIGKHNGYVAVKEVGGCDYCNTFKIGPIGSRLDTINFYMDKDGEIYAITGCFDGTIGQFIEEVKSKYPNNIYGETYLAACSLAKKMFKLFTDKGVAK